MSRSLARPQFAVYRGLGDAETDTDCPEPTTTADRDQLRDKLGKYAGWGPGTYDQWHEGHPDIRAALDDIGGRMKGLYDRPKLLRCSKEARNKASTWIQQLHSFLCQIKSACNSGYDASGFTRVPTAFNWTFYNGPTYKIRSTSDPDVNRTMHDWCVKVWGAAACPGGAPASGQAPTPATTPTTPSGEPVPAGSVVVNGQAYSSMAEAQAAQASGAVPPGPADMTGTSPLSTPVFSSLPASVGGIPTSYLIYGAGALLAYKVLFGRR